ncbi:MAG: hypothetical protein ABFS39_09325 [Pseudomonadota bacterium]
MEILQKVSTVDISQRIKAAMHAMSRITGEWFSLIIVVLPAEPVQAVMMVPAPQENLQGTFKLLNSVILVIQPTTGEFQISPTMG